MKLVALSNMMMMQGKSHMVKDDVTKTSDIHWPFKKFPLQKSRKIHAFQKFCEGLSTEVVWDCPKEKKVAKGVKLGLKQHEKYILENSQAY